MIAAVWVNPNASDQLRKVAAIDTKVAALRAHKSQMKDWDPEERIKEWAATRGKGKEMAYAESFRVITLVNDEQWEKTKGRVLPIE